MNAGDVFARVLPWLAALVALVAVGALVVWAIRRWLDRGAEPPEGFTLHDLRRLRASGQLTEEEFDRAKASVIGRLSAGEEADSAGERPEPGA